MYAFIRGKLISSSSSHAIVDVAGVGYEIHIPSITSLEIGKEVLFHTSFIVREGFQGLYGFLKAEEKELFKILIEISGVGPKIAMALISSISLPRLHEIILEEDVKALSTVPGIGKKSAERLLIELRNKLETFFTHTPISPQENKNQKQQDALKALVHLGYNHSAASKALKKTLQEEGELDLSNLISQSLKYILK